MLPINEKLFLLEEGLGILVALQGSADPDSLAIGLDAVVMGFSV